MAPGAQFLLPGTLNKKIWSLVSAVESTLINLGCPLILKYAYLAFLISEKLNYSKKEFFYLNVFLQVFMQSKL